VADRFLRKEEAPGSNPGESIIAVARKIAIDGNFDCSSRDLVLDGVQQFSSIHWHQASKSSAPHWSAIECNVPVGISSSDFIGTLTIRTSSVSGLSHLSLR
jgi:hypothetical protein